MAAAGEAEGLPADIAMQLARATVCGAGELAHRSPDTAAQLRINVTSPGGTTAAALAHLMDPDTGLPPLMRRAVHAAAERGQGVGQVTITYDDFAKVDIRVGTITRAEPFPEARKPAYKLWVDFGGDLGEKRSSAQITRHYTPETLIGRQVLAVVNFPPRQIGKVLSEVLVLGVPDAEGEVVLIGPGHDVPIGGRLF